jgi:NAD(P)-dependent dehydrogenase (short-subunit alcohol dehydrogenase family)
LRELSAEAIEDFWRVGCFAGFLVGREAARRLAPLGRGTPIFTSASGSLGGKPGFAHFAAAKAGLP